MPTPPITTVVTVEITLENFQGPQSVVSTLTEMLRFPVVKKAVLLEGQSNYVSRLPETDLENKAFDKLPVVLIELTR